MSQSDESLRGTIRLLVIVTGVCLFAVGYLLAIRNEDAQIRDQAVRGRMLYYERYAKEAMENGKDCSTWASGDGTWYFKCEKLGTKGYPTP